MSSARAPRSAPSRRRSACRSARVEARRVDRPLPALGCRCRCGARRGGTLDTWRGQRPRAVRAAVLHGAAPVHRATTGRAPVDVRAPLAADLIHRDLRRGATGEAAALGSQIRALALVDLQFLDRPEPNTSDEQEAWPQEQPHGCTLATRRAHPQSRGLAAAGSAVWRDLARSSVDGSFDRNWPACPGSVRTSDDLSAGWTFRTARVVIMHRWPGAALAAARARAVHAPLHEDRPSRAAEVC
jgi:hypothetical protein